MSKLVAVVIGAALLASGSLRAEPEVHEVRLRDLVYRYVMMDRELEASMIKVEASRDEKTAKSYVPYPSFRLDLTSPDRSYYRTYAYRTYLDTLYRGFREYESEYYRLSLTLSQRLPTGGDLSVQGVGRRATSDFTYGGFPPEVPLEREAGDREFLSDVGVSVRQPVLGLWERKDEVRRASLNHEKQQAQFLLDSATITKRALNAFFDFLIDQDRLAIDQMRYDQALHDAEEAERLFDLNLVGEIEMLEKKVAANNADIVLRESMATAIRSIGRVTEFVPGQPFELVPENLTEEIPVERTYSAPEASPRVIIARRDVDLAKVTLAQTRRRRFGQTTVSLSYGFQGIGDDFSEARREFGRNRWGGSFNIGLTLPEPGLGSDMELARANLKVAESAHEDALEETVVRQSLLDDHTMNLRANLKLHKRRVELMERLIETKREQFDQQVISQSEMVDLEIDLTEARIEYLETMRKLNIAWVDLVSNRGEDPVELLRASLSGSDDSGGR